MLEAMPPTRSNKRSNTYERISLDKWNRIRAKAGGFGLQIPTDNGQGCAFGVTVEWRWTTTAMLLTVRVLNPGIVSYDEALEFLDSIIKAA